MLAKLGRLEEVNAMLVDALWRATTEHRGNGHAATEEMAGRTLQ
jgi:hypothetical protein